MKSSHRVNGIIIQPQVQGSHQAVPSAQINRYRQRSIDKNEDQHIPVYNAGKKVVPARRTKKIQEIDYVAFQKEAWKKDMLWLLFQLHDKESNNTAGWTGFNIRVHSINQITENSLGYLSSVNAAATNQSTINKVLRQSIQIK